jgi:hypothetical protein
VAALIGSKESTSHSALITANSGSVNISVSNVNKAASIVLIGHATEGLRGVVHTTLQVDWIRGGHGRSSSINQVDELSALNHVVAVVTHGEGTQQAVLTTALSGVISVSVGIIGVIQRDDTAAVIRSGLSSNKRGNNRVANTLDGSIDREESEPRHDVVNQGNVLFANNGMTTVVTSSPCADKAIGVSANLGVIIHSARVRVGNGNGRAKIASSGGTSGGGSKVTSGKDNQNFVFNIAQLVTRILKNASAALRNDVLTTNIAEASISARVDDSITALYVRIFRESNP